MAIALAALVLPGAAAQRANDDAITAAEDAFGTSIGRESIGIYSASQVRGFSPVTAGNVRLEGVYVDRQGTINQRLVSGSTVRVGLSAQGYPFPAPTGIVDYRLRGSGDKALLSVVTGSLAYGAPTVELDGQLPLGPHMGIAGGASYTHEEYYDGSDADYVRAALIPRWKPAAGIEIMPFWSYEAGANEKAPPTIFAADAFVPPAAPRRAYFGQRWAERNSYSVNAGAIAKARIGQDWAIVGGAFRSIFANRQNFAELFTGTTREGTTREQVVPQPGQRYASTSGELRVSRSVVDGARLHVVHLSARSRRVNSRYGGDAPAIDLGVRPLGERRPVEEPSFFAFTGATRDRVRQTTFGLAYEGRWKNVGELMAGVQRANYRKAVAQPNLPQAVRRDRPWLFDLSAAAYLTSRLALYAAHVRGLEESGLAPASAANRNQALPAIRTRQSEAGLRWTLARGVKLVAGAFDVRKPYFNTDEANVFTTLGDQRHRGIELSLSGEPAKTLNLVAGAVLMRPRVTGPAVEQGRVGRRPLGQAGRVLRASAEYRPAWAGGVSVDVALANVGKRASSRDNLVSVPPYTLLDLGVRYRFRLGKSPATFRVQVANATNTFYWNILGSGSYGLTDKRRLLAYLAADF